jgi:hypothetical protein
LPTSTVPICFGGFALNRGVGFGARACKKDNFYRRGPVKVIEIIRTPQIVLIRCSLQPLSPIQNNSDLAQGPQRYSGG